VRQDGRAHGCRCACPGSSTSSRVLSSRPPAEGCLSRRPPQERRSRGALNLYGRRAQTRPRGFAGRWQLEALRVLTDRREALTCRRVQTVDQLQALLAELVAGQSKRDITGKAKAMLASVWPVTSPERRAAGSPPRSCSSLASDRPGGDPPGGPRRSAADNAARWCRPPSGPHSPALVVARPLAARGLAHCRHMVGAKIGLILEPLAQVRRVW
jgi:hypothetical protein